MIRKTVDQMFGKVARNIAAAERDELDRKIEEARQEREREARLDEPLRRRDVLDAIERVRYRYNEYHHSATLELLNRLTKALE